MCSRDLLERSLCAPLGRFARTEGWWARPRDYRGRTFRLKGKEANLSVDHLRALQLGEVRPPGAGGGEVQPHQDPRVHNHLQGGWKPSLLLCIADLIVTPEGIVNIKT